MFYRVLTALVLGVCSTKGGSGKRTESPTFSLVKKMNFNMAPIKAPLADIFLFSVCTSHHTNLNAGA